MIRTPTTTSSLDHASSSVSAPAGWMMQTQSQIMHGPSIKTFSQGRTQFGPLGRPSALAPCSCISISYGPPPPRPQRGNQTDTTHPRICRMQTEARKGRDVVYLGSQRSSRPTPHSPLTTAQRSSVFKLGEIPGNAHISSDRSPSLR